jgi:hypothetical protein
MPIHRGRDTKGSYYQWGSQKKYYYMPGDTRSMKRAYAQAIRQAQAIYAHGYR